MRYAVLAAILILTACGNSSAPQAQASPEVQASATPPPTGIPSPSPKASPTPKPEFLFAVLESGSSFAEPGTVAIVGLDGYARAKSTFQPRKNPGAILQSTAQVVGSGVYYIDGKGTVRVLRAHTAPVVVATFPLAPGRQYDIWFAVSPDGSRVLAGILTFPLAQPTWKFDLESATSGGTSKVLVHSEFAYGGNEPTTTFPVGWSSTRPVAMVGAPLTTQNFWPGGPLYVIDDSGRKARQLGGSDCNSDKIASSGLIPCTSGLGRVTVRDQGGKIVWTTHVDGGYAPRLFISPDGQAISDDAQVEKRIGGMVPMPSGFRVEGWLDKNTVVGRVQQQNGESGNLLWISLSHPSAIHDLGFKGDFVATLATL